MKQEAPGTINFQEVSIDEAAAAAVEQTPAERQAELEAKFGQKQIPVSVEKELDIHTKVEAIKNSVAAMPTTPSSPEKAQEVQPSTSIEKSEPMSPESIAIDKLRNKYPGIEHKTFEDARRTIINTHSKTHFDGIEPLALPVITVAMAALAANATAIPGFLTALATGGGTGAVTTAGLAVAGLFGVVPIVGGAALVAYGGYKFLKRFRENNKIKKDEELLDTAFGNR